MKSHISSAVLKSFQRLMLTKDFGQNVSDYESSIKTTFNTHKGRYRYLRMPMGAKSSQDAFQMEMDRILEGLHGVIAIHDDITIYGTDDEDHDRNIIAFMERAAQKGLTLNSKKCCIKQPCVSFFGVTFSADGMSPDPKKIQGIVEHACTTGSYTTAVIPRNGQLYAPIYSAFVCKHSTTPTTSYKEYSVPMDTVNTTGLPETERL